VVRETLLGAIATQLMQQDDEVVSLFHRRLEHGYPIPSLDRNAALEKALPWLKQHGIYSRGRFGSYKVSLGTSAASSAKKRPEHMCCRANARCWMATAAMADSHRGACGHHANPSLLCTTLFITFSHFTTMCVFLLWWLKSALQFSPQYEVGNQDHSLMLGVEAVDNILFGCKELTLSHPDIVNSLKNTELQYRIMQEGTCNEVQA